MTRPVLVGQFWGLDSDRILKLVLREIILSLEAPIPALFSSSSVRRLCAPGSPIATGPASV
jgi:hypothetical protein